MTFEPKQITDTEAESIAKQVRFHFKQGEDHPNPIRAEHVKEIAEGIYNPSHPVTSMARSLIENL